MVVLRPGSSVLKPGVRERQRELESVISKYEVSVCGLVALVVWVATLMRGRVCVCFLASSFWRSVERRTQILHPWTCHSSCSVLQVGILALLKKCCGKVAQRRGICAECRLCLVRLQRTAWQIDQSGHEAVPPNVDGEDDDPSTPDVAETMQTTLQDMLEKTRRLYQVPSKHFSLVLLQFHLSSSSTFLAAGSSQEHASRARRSASSSRDWGAAHFLWGTRRWFV